VGDDQDWEMFEEMIEIKEVSWINQKPTNE
jgi:hypothetical protein